MWTRSKNHLAEARKTYVSHFLYAWTRGWLLIWTGICSIIHGFLPGVFPFTAPKTVLRIAEEIPASDREKILKT